MRPSKALVLVMFLFLLVPFLSAGETAQEISETRSALLESYERAISLAEMSEQAFLEAAEAREAAAQHADSFIEAVEAGNVEEAVEFAMLADRSTQEAEQLEQKARRHEDDAEAELDSILGLARQYAGLSRDAAAADRDAARAISDILGRLDAEEPEPVVEEPAPVDEAPEEVAVAEEEEQLWQLVDVYVVEDGMKYYPTQEYLTDYPVYAEIGLDQRFILTHDGITVHGDVVFEDDMVGLVPDTFVGIPEETADYFFDVVDAHGVVLPDIYWFDLSVDNDVAMLDAHGTIDGMDYHAHLAFTRQ